MRLLVVSDTAPYSTFDVYNGYCLGLEDLNIPYETVNLVDLLGNYSFEVAMGLLVSKALIKENAFSHIVIIAGTMIPKWVLETLHYYGKQVCMVATDDPHSSKMLLESKEFINYYFTCEKNMAKDEARIYYLPTAATSLHLKASERPKDSRYYSDVCFIGSVYPNRIKPLENAIKWCINNNKKINLFGPIQGRTTYGELFVPENSIIHSFGKHCIVANEEASWYYNNAKVVLNMDRDTKWSPAFLRGNPHNVNCEPVSCNPRVYEVAACRTNQLYIEARQEAADIFGNNLWYSTTEGVGNALTSIFSAKQSVLNKKANACFEIVKKSHTYTNRVAKMLEYLIKH